MPHPDHHERKTNSIKCKNIAVSRLQSEIKPKSSSFKLYMSPKTINHVRVMPISSSTDQSTTQESGSTAAQMTPKSISTSKMSKHQSMTSKDPSVIRVHAPRRSRTFTNVFEHLKTAADEPRKIHHDVRRRSHSDVTVGYVRKPKR